MHWNMTLYVFLIKIYEIIFFLFIVAAIPCKYPINKKTEQCRGDLTSPADTSGTPCHPAAWGTRTDELLEPHWQHRRRLSDITNSLIVYHWPSTTIGLLGWWREHVSPLLTVSGCGIQTDYSARLVSWCVLNNQVKLIVPVDCHNARTEFHILSEI